MFGRTVLHEYEMKAMRISNSIADMYHMREISSDWALWNKKYPDAANLLDWAAQEYEKWQVR